MRVPSFTPKKIMNHGKECWQINIPALYSPKKKRERLIFDTKSKADAKSRQLKAAAQKFGSNLPTLSHDLHAQVVKVIRKLEPHGIRLEEAVDGYLERVQQLESSITYSELVDAVVKHKRDRGKREKYVGDVRQKGRRFLPFFGDKKICDISTLEIDEAVSNLEIAPSSKRVYRRYLRLIFNQALEWQMLDKNPVPPNKKEITERKEPSIFTPEQVQTLLHGATDELLPYYVLAVFCGIRPTEITRLSWDKVHFEEKVIRVGSSQSKTKLPRLVKINETAFAWLKKFKGKSGKIIPDSFRAKFDQNRKDTGLFSAWSSDVLRHTCATYHATLHEEYEKTAYLLGHDVATLKRYYFQPVLKTVADKFWKLRPKN